MVQQPRAASGRGGLRVRGLAPARDALHQPHDGVAGTPGDRGDGDNDRLLLTTTTTMTAWICRSGCCGRTAVAAVATVPTARTA